MTYTVPVFKNQKPNKGPAMLIERVLMATHSFEPLGALLGDLGPLVNRSPDEMSSLVARYIQKGRMFKAGPPMRQRYFVSAEARDAALPHIEKAEADRLIQRADIVKNRAIERSAKEKAERAAKPSRRKRIEDFFDAVCASGTDGVQLKDLNEKFGTCDKGSYLHMTQLSKSGRVVHAKVGRVVWWYGTKEEAEAGTAIKMVAHKAHRKAMEAIRSEKKRAREHKRRVEAAKLRPVRVKAEKPPRVRKSRAVAPKPKREGLPGKKLVASASQPVKVDNFKTAPATNPNNVQPQKTECKPMWFEVTEPVIGGFKAMGLGQYLPAESWASKALGVAA